MTQTALAPATQIVETAWRDQAVWSETANPLRTELTRWRSRAAVADVAGAALETLAASLPEQGEVAQVRTGLALLGAVVLAVIPSVVRTQHSHDQVRDWVHARSASEALKEEIYRYLVGAPPFRPSSQSSELLARCLATCSEDRFAQVWAVQDFDGDELTAVRHESSVTTLAFSPDSLWLATGSTDGTARLWDLTHPARDPTIVTVQERGVWTLAFNPDGAWLAAGTGSGTVRVWLISEPGLVEAACRAAGRNLSVGGWHQFVGDTPYRETCPSLPQPSRSDRGPAVRSPF